MKFFGILSISMVVHVANGAGVKLEVESAASSSNKWLTIDRDDSRRIGRTRVEQPITDDENWEIYYVIQDTRTEMIQDIEKEFISICYPELSSQKANVVDLFVKALGIAGKACPMQPQTVDQPSPIIEGVLDLDIYDNVDRIRLTMTLVKREESIVEISLNGRVKENRR